MDIRTESRNLTMTPGWQQEIESRLHGLQNGHEDILHARMILEKNRHHKKGPRIATARLVCNVRGATFWPRGRPKSHLKSCWPWLVQSFTIGLLNSRRSSARSARI